MLLAVAVPFLTSCSDDDDVNTAECTVGFESANYAFSEASGGYVSVPIQVSGHRNGPVRVVVSAAPSGEVQAIEGEHYVITDKTLNLNADTLGTGTINVQLKLIDDDEINPAREFTLSIVSAEGAQITTQQTTVTIKDNDGNFYEAFFGKWTMTATSVVSKSQITKEITFGGTTDESNPNYETMLTAEASNFLGAGEQLNWNILYEFYDDTKEGVIGFVCGEPIGKVATQQGEVDLIWAYDSGNGKLGIDVLPIEWKLDENGRLPKTLVVPSNYTLYMGTIIGGNQFSYFDAYYDIVLTKK